jgi:predicted metal-dependent phosphoesterase TrpH
MRTRIHPLLCELHAHSRWSDGELSIAELVDLHGRAGFDVLCVTDHVVRSNDPWREIDGARVRSIDESRWEPYLADVEREGRRALAMYGLVVVPGLELTFNNVESVKAAHAVAVGLRRFVSVEGGIASAMRDAREAGAALIAAHPFDGPEPESLDLRVTRRFVRDEGLRSLAHRFELFNRSHLFGWVAEAGLPAVAGGDVHRVEHLSGWRTLIPCERDGEAVVAYLRSPRPVYLAKLEPTPTRIAA